MISWLVRILLSWAAGALVKEFAFDYVKGLVLEAAKKPMSGDEKYKWVYEALNKFVNTSSYIKNLVIEIAVYLAKEKTKKDDYDLSDV